MIRPSRLYPVRYAAILGIKQHTAQGLKYWDFELNTDYSKGEIMPTEKQLQKEMDYSKAFIEYLKFLITISTGSIVVLTSFLERLESQPELGYLIGIALSAFMLSIVAALIQYTMLLYTLGTVASITENIFGGLIIAVVWGSFLIAIVSLTIFGLVNLK
jgi:hypothetical protein